MRTARHLLLLFAGAAAAPAAAQAAAAGCVGAPEPLRAALAGLEAAVTATPAARRAALDAAAAAAAAAAPDAALAAALAALAEPAPTAARDDHDLRQLRAACTGCHLQQRPAVDLAPFPNRGNAVAGTVQLTGADGAARDDHAGVVVFLEAPELRSPPLPRPVSISQRGRRFVPPVAVATVGSTARFPNDDVVFHNVFSLSKGNAFDLGTYGRGEAQSRVLAAPGLVKVHCNIHPDMVAHLLVLPSHHAAVSDAQGRFVLAEVPDGDYTLRIWHTLAAPQAQPLSLRGGRVHRVALPVAETRPRLPHADKHGRPYKTRY